MQMKKRKIVIPVVIALLALVILLALLLSRCNAQPDEDFHESTSSTVSTGSVPSSTGERAPGSSVPATTLPSSTPASSTSAGSQPAQSTTAPTQQSTQATTKPTQPATQSTTSPAAPSCAHNFSQWEYEEYTYQQQGVYPDTQWHDRVSHRKYRTCTKCGYKEYGNTPDHPCQRGSANHAVTTIQEGNCLVMTIKRSTCKVCGWYVEYEGKKGSHTIKTETRHLTDYGAYTNELDAIISECTSCGAKAVNYQQGEGWSDYNRYRMKWSANPGAAYAGQPTTDNFAYVDHPEWQMVFRNFKYDSEGYVKEFTIYWWYNGSRYSQVIDCGEGVWESWFAEYGLSTGNVTYQIRCCGTYWAPYKSTWTS